MTIAKSTNEVSFLDMLNNSIVIELSEKLSEHVILRYMNDDKESLLFVFISNNKCIGMLMHTKFIIGISNVNMINFLAKKSNDENHNKTLFISGIDMANYFACGWLNDRINIHVDKTENRTFISNIIH